MSYNPFLTTKFEVGDLIQGIDDQHLLKARIIGVGDEGYKIYWIGAYKHIAQFQTFPFDIIETFYKRVST